MRARHNRAHAPPLRGTSSAFLISRPCSHFARIQYLAQHLAQHLARHLRDQIPKTLQQLHVRLLVMSTPQAKRRRLNEATKTLHKPFKSPFRAPLESKQPSSGSDHFSSDTSETGTYPRPMLKHLSTVHELLTSGQSTPTSCTLATTTSLIDRTSLPISARPRSLQERATSPKLSLTRESIQLRNDLNVLSQALKLATTTNDDDLIALIERWRGASRAAAEELFATTRDRVNRMGGVGAWKEREREQTKWKLDAQREELDVERLRMQEAMYEARKRGELSEEAYEHYANMDTETQKEEVEETYLATDDDVSGLRIHQSMLCAHLFQSFTMDTMLATLNIDLDLIGFNKEAQRWDG